MDIEWKKSRHDINKEKLYPDLKRLYFKDLSTKVKLLREALHQKNSKGWIDSDEVIWMWYNFDLSTVSRIFLMTLI